MMRCHRGRQETKIDVNRTVISRRKAWERKGEEEIFGLKVQRREDERNGEEGTRGGKCPVGLLPLFKPDKLLSISLPSLSRQLCPAPLYSNVLCAPCLLSSPRHCSFQLSVTKATPIATCDALCLSVCLSVCQ